LAGGASLEACPERSRTGAGESDRAIEVNRRPTYRFAFATWAKNFANCERTA